MKDRAYRPGIFWTWQDEHVRNETDKDGARRIEKDLASIAGQGFASALIQPRGCRYAIDDPLFIQQVSRATEVGHQLGLAIWLHLDPRSFSRQLIAKGGEAVDYIIVAGTEGQAAGLSLARRPVDVEAPIVDGQFEITLHYPVRRPYHVHSDGAIWFRPVRVERCFAFRRTPQGLVESKSVQDITAHTRLFTNCIADYVTVLGHWSPPRPGQWYAVAFIAFASNYPDYAGPKTAQILCQLLEQYAERGASLDGIWWDEPGYCTGFDRRFRSDRGRLPYSSKLAAMYQEKTGRSAPSDLLYLLYETDDLLWGKVRRDFYETLSDAVFGLQERLAGAARALFGDDTEVGVHHTWHQNADDLVHGSMNWWKGCQVLTGGFTDVGSAEEVDNPEQFGETVAMAVLATSLARRARRPDAFINLWGVNYGGREDAKGPAIIDYWADLMGTLGCRWLAHIYGPTGYFEKPSVWGPGYPDHPTWGRMKSAGDRLAQALEIAEGALPHSDVAVVYPLGAFGRLGSDRANPIARGVHMLIYYLVEAGFEPDIISSAELQAGLDPEQYRGVLYLHPFGAEPADVVALEALRRQGVQVIVAGLPAASGAGYAGPDEWTTLLGKGAQPGLTWPEFGQAREGEKVTGPDGTTWAYSGLSGWGRPAWPYHADSRAIAVDGIPVGMAGEGFAYGQFFLEGLLEQAPEFLASLGLGPGWSKPADSLATRTFLPDGSIVIRACPARFGTAFSGEFLLPQARILVQGCRGLFAVRITQSGEITRHLALETENWHSERR